MVSARLEIWQARLTEARTGKIYDSINQNLILDTFSCHYPDQQEFPRVSALYFRTQSNPLEMAISCPELVSIIQQEASVIWSDQTCEKFGEVDIVRMLPPEGNYVPLDSLVHVFSHVLLTYAINSREPFVSRESLVDQKFIFQDRVYLNAHNQKEALLACNFPTRIYEVAGYAGIILTFFNAWMAGEKRSGLIKVLRRQADLNWDVRTDTNKQPRTK